MKRGILLAALLVFGSATPRSAPANVAGLYPAGRVEASSDLRRELTGAPHERASLFFVQPTSSYPATLRHDGGAPLPAAASVSEPLIGYGSGQPAQTTPAPSGEIGTALVGGVATWFDAPGLQAAVPWWRPGQDPVPLRVCTDGSRCTLVTATGFCACGHRNGRMTVADLSRKAFARLAPLSQGVVEVTIEWPIGLPATDTP